MGWGYPMVIRLKKSKQQIFVSCKVCFLGRPRQHVCFWYKFQGPCVGSDIRCIKSALCASDFAAQMERRNRQFVSNWGPHGLFLFGSRPTAHPASLATAPQRAGPEPSALASKSGSHCPFEHQAQAIWRADTQVDAVCFAAFYATWMSNQLSK